MTPEQAIAAGLARWAGSLVPGVRHPVMLDQVVADGAGRWRRGPHPIGWLETSSTGLRIKLINTVATRTAVGLLAEDLLDVVLTNAYPPTVVLAAGGS